MAISMNPGSSSGFNFEQARFDTRLPKVQKQLFEKAALLGGYRSLTEFVLSTMQKRSMEIIAENEQLLASQQDQEVFFDALTQPAPPNQALRAALEEFQAEVGE